VRRRLFTFFSALSLLVFVAVCGLWVQSNRAEARSSEMPAGGYRLLNSRGQLALLHHRAGVTGRNLWVKTTVYLGGSDARDAVVKALICDAAAPFDQSHPETTVVLSRPYVLLPEGHRVSNAGGFGAHVARLLLPINRPGVSPWAGS
jgi:hypothetical protein